MNRATPRARGLPPPDPHPLDNPLRLARRPEPPGTRAPPVRARPLSSPLAGPRSSQDSGRATKQGLGVAQSPHMRLTDRREPRGRPDRPASRNHILAHQPPRNGGIKRYPLTTPPPYEGAGSRLASLGPNGPPLTAGALRLCGKVRGRSTDETAGPSPAASRRRQTRRSGRRTSSAPGAAGAVSVSRPDGRASRGGGARVARGACAERAGATGGASSCGR